MSHLGILGIDKVTQNFRNGLTAELDTFYDDAATAEASEDQILTVITSALISILYAAYNDRLPYPSAFVTVMATAAKGFTDAIAADQALNYTATPDQPGARDHRNVLVVAKPNGCTCTARLMEPHHLGCALRAVPQLLAGKAVTK